MKSTLQFLRQRQQGNSLAEVFQDQLKQREQLADQRVQRIGRQLIDGWDQTEKKVNGLVAMMEEQSCKEDLKDLQEGFSRKAGHMEEAQRVLKESTKGLEEGARKIRQNVVELKGDFLCAQAIASNPRPGETEKKIVQLGRITVKRFAGMR
ncbi:MAG: hypothetical protein HW387_1367 [Parachlamydiales bacterium]|nr:hypothetical protein [Parachlamydiales bacterium]